MHENETRVLFIFKLSHKITDVFRHPNDGIDQGDDNWASFFTQNNGCSIIFRVFR